MVLHTASKIDFLSNNWFFCAVILKSKYEFLNKNWTFAALCSAGTSKMDGYWLELFLVAFVFSSEIDIFFNTFFLWMGFVCKVRLFVTFKFKKIWKFSTEKFCSLKKIFFSDHEKVRRNILRGCSGILHLSVCNTYYYVSQQFSDTIQDS